MTPRPPARLFLLPAKEKSVVIVLRRGPSRWVHVMKWNTLTDEIEHGSWFNGRIYEEACDVSFDGEWMIYAAFGQHCEQWQAVCRPPWLKAVAVAESSSNDRSGIWTHKNLLKSGLSAELLRSVQAGDLPFKVRDRSYSIWRVPLSPLFERLARDGWQSVTRRDEGLFSQGATEMRIRPSRRHPELVLYRQGAGLRFEMPDIPGVIDERTTWATYDSEGSLIAGRAGILERYSFDDLLAGRPTFVFDTNALKPPVRPVRPFVRSERVHFALSLEPGQVAVYGVSQGNPAPDPYLTEDLFRWCEASFWAILTNQPRIIKVEGQPFKFLAKASREVVWDLLNLTKSNGHASIAIAPSTTLGKEAASLQSALRWLEKNGDLEITFLAHDTEHMDTLLLAYEAL